MEMEETITITLEEYRNLVKASARIEAFSDFVIKSDYSISRETCGHFLGFELVEKNE